MGKARYILTFALWLGLGSVAFGQVTVASIDPLNKTNPDTYYILKNGSWVQELPGGTGSPAIILKVQTFPRGLKFKWSVTIAGPSTPWNFRMEEKLIGIINKNSNVIGSEGTWYFTLFPIPTGDPGPTPATYTVTVELQDRFDGQP